MVKIAEYTSVVLFITSLAIALFTISEVFADTGEKVLIISEKLGETIDTEEREKYGLFPATKGFKEAVFLQLENGDIVAEVTYVIDGEEKKIRIPQSEEVINSLRDYLENFDGVKHPLEEHPEEYSIGKESFHLPDSSTIQFLTTTDGSQLVGRIIEIRETEIVFQTSFGIMTISIANIREVKDVKEELMIEGSYWFPSPNATRLFFAPTGRCLKRGEVYFADYYLFFTSLTLGINDYITVGGGASLWLWAGIENNILYFTPKVGLIQRENFGLSMGALMVKLPDWGSESAPAVGILYSVGTWGNPNRSITGGIGYGYLDWELADKPMVMIGGEVRAARRISFVTENWTIPGVEGALLSYGMRFFGESLSVDLAFINSTQGMIFPGIPYIDFVYKF
jgi:hypothetical protein